MKYLPLVSKNDRLCMDYWNW